MTHDEGSASSEKFYQQTISNTYRGVIRNGMFKLGGLTRIKTSMYAQGPEIKKNRSTVFFELQVSGRHISE
jgi:hypothetical protein